MTSFENKLAQEVISSDGYSQSSGKLFDTYISNILGEQPEIERSVIKNLISSAQIFYKSDDNIVKKEGAVLLSMILDICADEHPDLIPIANSIFVNSGDFPNIELLIKRFPDSKFKYNFYSQAQIDFKRDLNTVDELSTTLTDFQRSLWEHLNSDQDVITSAPTSAGKTHIILSYLIGMVAKSEESFAAILVPTRALISEVAAKIYALVKERDLENQIDVCTVSRDEKYKSRTFFVMTQERLNDVLLKGDISFNYLFIDEAHNISDSSRGVLLHMIIERMMEDSFPQIIISMPSSNYKNCFSSIFDGVEFIKEITEHSPVAKLIMSVEPKGRNLRISRKNSSNEKQIKKEFLGTDLADIVYRLGRGQSNIIYRNRPYDCENMANEISKRITKTHTNNLLEEAANYIETFVHEEFTLAESLRKGVAFHYGPLPSSVRVMIENLVKEDLIRFIACTSTLAEGVNLPAKNLFLKNPLQVMAYAPSERIEDVKIRNITGRAGRMLQHFSGNIFLVEPDSWSYKDYLVDDHREEHKIPTYFKSLNEDIKEIISALRGEYNHNDESLSRIYTIANKLIKEFANDNLEKTMGAKELSLNNKDRKSLENSIKFAYEKLEVATFTLEANPSVGYIQQNNLFMFLNSQDSLENLVFPHPQSPDLYKRLLNVCQILCEYSVYLPSNNYTLEHICTITRKWICGKSLKEIIIDQVRRDKEYAEEQSEKPVSVNTSVRNVIKIINGDIQFKLSNALRCYQMLLDNIMISKGINLTNIKLHSYIEIGACNDRMISLIGLGLSRESAKDIEKVLSDKDKIETRRDLLKLKKLGRLDTIHAITMKELNRLFS